MFSFKRKGRETVSESAPEYGNAVFADSMFNDDPELLADMINAAKEISESVNVSYGGGANGDAHDRLWEWAGQWKPSVQGLSLGELWPRYTEIVLSVDLGSYVSGVGSEMLEPMLRYLQAAAPKLQIVLVKDESVCTLDDERDLRFEVTAVEGGNWAVQAVILGDFALTLDKTVFTGDLDSAFKFVSDHAVSEFI